MFQVQDQHFIIKFVANSILDLAGIHPQSVRILENAFNQFPAKDYSKFTSTVHHKSD